MSNQNAVQQVDYSRSAGLKIFEVGFIARKQRGKDIPRIESVNIATATVDEAIKKVREAVGMAGFITVTVVYVELLATETKYPEWVEKRDRALSNKPEPEPFVEEVI